MRALELSLRNYRVFEEVELELPARVIGVFGENGSGKTTLMESIGFALYGVDAARTKKQEIRTQGILTDCLVRLAFEHGGQHYEVRRSLKGRGHAPEAELFVGDLLLASGTTDVDLEIQRLLHMDLRVFRSSAFAEQKQLDAFSEVTPGKRKEMALRLLGIRPVEDALAAARREARASTQSAEELLGTVADVAELEARLKEAKDVAREARERATTAARELKEATAAFREAKGAFETSDAARQRVEKLVVALRATAEEHGRVAAQRADLTERVERLWADLEKLPEIEEELEGLAGVDATLRAAERLTDASGELTKLEARLARLPDVDAEAALSELRGARSGARDAQRTEADARAKHAHEVELLEGADGRLAQASKADPSQPCPTCGRELGADFAAYVRHCKGEASGAKKRVTAAARALKAASATKGRAESELARAEKTREGLLAAETKRQQLAGQVVALRAEAQALAEPFDGRPPDLESLRAGVRRVKELGEQVVALRTERKRLRDSQRDLAKADERLADLERRQRELAAEAEGLSFDAEEHANVRRELAGAESQLESARGCERKAKDDLGQARLDVGRAEGEIKQARDTAARADELRSGARHLERVVMLLNGFRDHLIARVGPELSREAEALFRELTNHDYDDLRIDEETLTIQIADGDAYHPIERFSGSETDLANLALRVAISVHLSRVSGADLGLMVLDEVLGSLDQERRDLMVQTMGRLASRFHQLFVVTHAEQVKDQFPASIEVRKVGRRRSTAVLV